MGNTPYAVHVTRMADRDIAETTNYLLSRLEFQAAKDFIDAIERAVESLEQYPFRMHTPHELQEYPDTSIREMPVFSHRLIYRVLDRDVFVLFVPHGKRSIEDELIASARWSPNKANPGSARRVPVPIAAAWRTKWLHQAIAWEAVQFPDGGLLLTRRCVLGLA